MSENDAEAVLTQIQSSAKSSSFNALDLKLPLGVLTLIITHAGGAIRVLGPRLGQLEQHTAPDSPACVVYDAHGHSRRAFATTHLLDECARVGRASLTIDSRRFAGRPFRCVVHRLPHPCDQHADGPWVGRCDSVAVD